MNNNLNSGTTSFGTAGDVLVDMAPPPTEETVLRRPNFSPISPMQSVAKITQLAVPMALSYTFSFSIVALGIMAGRIQSEEESNEQDYINAAALSATLINTLLVIALSSLYSISIYGSSKRGELQEIKDELYNETPEETITDARFVELKGEISRLIKNGFLISSAVTPPAFFALFYSQALLEALGQNEEVAALAQTYLRPFAGAVLGLLFRLCEEQVMFSFKKQQAAMIIGLASFALGVFLADIMCFGYLGLPKLNLAGIAYGFTIESYLVFAAFGLYLALEKTFKNYNFFTNFSFKKQDWEQIKALLTIGAPITLTLSMEISSMLVISLFAGILGTDSLTAYSFWAQFYFFVLIPLIALGNATCQEVSSTIGASRVDASKTANVGRLAKYGLLTSVAIIMPLCILVSAYPDLLKLVITNQDISDAVMDVVKVLIPIIAVGGVPFDTARYNMLQTLRATGNNMIPTLISVANTWLGVLLAYLLGFHTSMGIVGLGTGYSIGLVTGALSLLPIWLKTVHSYEVQQAPLTGYPNNHIQEEAAAAPSETTPLMAPHPDGSTYRLCPEFNWSWCPH